MEIDVGHVERYIEHMSPMNRFYCVSNSYIDFEAYTQPVKRMEVSRAFHEKVKLLEFEN